MKKIFFMGFMVFIVSNSFAQSYYYYYSPKMSVGSSGALFRISHDGFDDVYTSRYGLSNGFHLGWNAYKSHFLMAKVRFFEKSGKSGLHPVSGLDLNDAVWQERWYTIGLRVQPTITSKRSAYYGFGVAFYDVDETDQLSLFETSNTQSSDELGSGFYLELGFQYFLIEKSALFFEVEIASGGIRGRSGFEALSVGGFRYALGISFFPF